MKYYTVKLADNTGEIHYAEIRTRYAGTAKRLAVKMLEGIYGLRFNAIEATAL